MSFFENIERFVKSGYTLSVVPREDKFHASVGGLNDGHNYVAQSIDEALRLLDSYLEDRVPYSAPRR
jgi:hypothetical protein